MSNEASPPNPRTSGTNLNPMTAPNQQQMQQHLLQQQQFFTQNFMHMQQFHQMQQMQMPIKTPYPLGPPPPLYPPPLNFNPNNPVPATTGFAPMHAYFGGPPPLPRQQQGLLIDQNSLKAKSNTVGKRSSGEQNEGIKKKRTKKSDSMDDNVATTSTSIIGVTKEVQAIGNFPIARVKRIMKEDKDVHSVASDATYLVGAAAVSDIYIKKSRKNSKV
ncbi:hypothetical protein HK096_008847 [Nowakowskiella sp. JEL0078]|nr:hypothetical protein HK096_008847 [Nowakowskiella sp. JEL0078]